MKTTLQIEKLEEAMSNILDVAKEFEGFGEAKFLKETASRLSQQIESLRECSICQSKIKIMPKAGSGVESHWICLKCVEENGIEVLPEYLENIEEFGHWHRPLGGKN